MISKKEISKFAKSTPGSKRKVYCNVYQTDNHSAKSPSIGSIFALSTHCTSGSLKKISKKDPVYKDMKSKTNLVPLRLRSYSSAYITNLM